MSGNAAKGTENTTTDKGHAPCEILPPTYTLPDLSEVMMDHNLMLILSKHTVTHSNLRIADCTEKPGTEECRICTLKSFAFLKSKRRELFINVEILASFFFLPKLGLWKFYFHFIA